jgi:hypothetical protein
MADYEAARNLWSAIQSAVTAIAIGGGAIWALWKYIIQVERHPHIESAADIDFIGQQDDFWIVEFAAIVENKGRVRHKIQTFELDVDALFEDDAVETNVCYGDQAYFPHNIIDGSFLPESSGFFFIDPGVKSRYSFIGRVPKKATMVMFHWRFEYPHQRWSRVFLRRTAQRAPQLSHSGEKTALVPREQTCPKPVGPTS